MLSLKLYNTSTVLNTIMKYNIEYDRTDIFDTVIASYIYKLMNSEYYSNLTEEQKHSLLSIYNHLAGV